MSKVYKIEKAAYDYATPGYELIEGDKVPTDIVDIVVYKTKSKSTVDLHPNGWYNTLVDASSVHLQELERRYTEGRLALTKCLEKVTTSTKESS